jgi:tetratricopeptide (TPR) repeat protein
LAKTAVCRKIDAEKETALAQRYRIRAYPTILFVKPDGTEIDRLVGYRDPKSFLTEARQALSGQDSVARAKANLKDAGSEDPSKRMQYARALQEKGRFAESLKEYLWCLDEGAKREPAFIGVRLSFLLSDIKRLGAEYPAAIDALKKRRDDAGVQMSAGSADDSLVIDFIAYNRELEQPERTLAAYDETLAKGGKYSGTLFADTLPLLIQKRRYADILSGTGDVPARIDQEIARYNQMVSFLPNDKSSAQYFKKSALETCGALYEALLGMNKSTEADVVRTKVLKFDGGVAGLSALVAHADSARNRDAIDSLLALAKSTLSEADFKKVEGALK